MSPRPGVRRLLQALKVSVALVVLGVAVIGFAHTERGRPLLRYIPGMGACPLGYDELTADQRARVRGELLTPLVGERAATSHRALAFELGRTTTDEVTAWATAHAVACGPGRKTGLRCTAVPAGALDQVAAFDELAFEFSADGRLVGLTGSASLTDATRVADYVAARDVTMRSQLGEPIERRGDARPEALNGPLAQISREYRSSDMRAKVMATDIGHGRFTVREFHQLIVAG